MQQFCLVIFVLLFTLCQCAKYNILALLPMASKSHKNVFIPLVEGLALRGHSVTMISPYNPTKTLPNLVEIAVDANRELMEHHQRSFFQTIVGKSQTSGFVSMSKTVEDGCRNYLNLKATIDMIKQEKTFDLVIVQAFMNECAVVVGTLVGKTVIYLNPALFLAVGNGAMPRPPSFVPSPFGEYPSKMNFYQRLTNSINTAKMMVTFKYLTNSNMQTIVSEMLPTAPSISEAVEQIGFHLYNSDPVMTPPIPGITNRIAVGGMHCVDGKPLPKKFEAFVQSSGEHGFIYFSLGSNAPSKYLPADIRNAFLSAFARLKHKVIWKYEEELVDKLDNVMTTGWAPQQDLLAHPKIRCFITHGGTLSLQETIYHAVPVIGIPLFGDQVGNMVRVTEELKIGEKLDVKNLTADTIYSRITKVLSDKSYAANLKTYSAILKDQPQKPLDRAIFWTEYIIRHNGAQHLRPIGEDLNFIKYFLLDVLAVLTLAVLAGLFVVVKLFKALLSTKVTKDTSVLRTKVRPTKPPAPTKKKQRTE